MHICWHFTRLKKWQGLYTAHREKTTIIVYRLHKGSNHITCTIFCVRKCRILFKGRLSGHVGMCISNVYIKHFVYTYGKKNHTISPSNKAGVFRSSSLQILQLIFISLHMEVHGPVINFKMSALKKCKKLTNQ